MQSKPKKQSKLIEHAYALPKKEAKTTRLVTANMHLVRSVRIRRFSGPYFPAFGLNTGKYGPEKLRIRTFITQRDMAILRKVIPSENPFSVKLFVKI